MATNQVKLGRSAVERMTRTERLTNTKIWGWQEQMTLTEHLTHTGIWLVMLGGVTAIAFAFYLG